jgi:hypothetical protein
LLLVVGSLISSLTVSSLGARAETMGALLLAPDPMVAIEPVSLSADPGGAVTAQVVIRDAVDLGGFEFTLAFDPQVIEITGVEAGNFVGSTGRSTIPLGPDIDNQGGRVTFGLVTLGSGAGPEGSGELALITIGALQEGSTALDLQDVQVFDTDGAEVASAVEDGQVTVGTGVSVTETPEPTETPTATAVAATASPSATSAPTTSPPTTSPPTATSTETPDTVTPTPSITESSPVPSAVPTATATERLPTPSETTGPDDGGSPVPSLTATEGADGQTPPATETEQAGGVDETPPGPSPGAPSTDTAEPTATAERGPEAGGVLSGGVGLVALAVGLALAGAALIIGGLLVFGGRRETGDAEQSKGV